MKPDAVRMGLLYPGGGAEHDYYLFAEAMDDAVKFFMIGTRVGGSAEDDHGVAALLRTAEVDNLVEGARRLVPLRPDVVLWACTSGSFIVGRRGAERQAEALTEVTKAPASSTSLAFVRALGALGLHRVAVLAPYPEEASRAFVRFVGEWSIEVCGFEWLGAPSGWDSAVMAPEAIVAAARRVNRPDAEAVLVPDTALPTLSFVEELERVLGKPVLTANQVTIWEGLRLARSGLRPVGYGRLLASTASGGV